MRANIGFIGLGMIGGSLARAIRRSHPDSYILACDQDLPVLETAKKEKVKKGDTIPVTISISPNYIRNREIINTSFVLITNDPSNPVRTVRIVGMID